MSERKTIYEILDTPEKELSKQELKRKKEFLARKAKVDAMPQQPCKFCGREIPQPLEYCSGACKRGEKIFGEEEETGRPDKKGTAEAQREADAN